MTKLATLLPYMIFHFCLIGLMVSPLHNLVKLVLCLLAFLVVFRQLSILDWVLFFGVNAFFTFMNAMAIRNGVFQFLNPDLIGLPWYEFLMWGMYVLHLKRFGEIFFVDELNSFKITIYDLTCLGLVALFFSVCGEKWQITLLPLLVNIFYLCYKKSKFLWAAYFYFILMGGILEVMGTRYLEWSYPSPDFAGVPFWYINVFGSFAIYFALVLSLLKAALAPNLWSIISLRRLVSRN